jgi:hypothetical protein
MINSQKKLFISKYRFVFMESIHKHRCIFTYIILNILHVIYLYFKYLGLNRTIFDVTVFSTLQENHHDVFTKKIIYT